MSSEQDSKPKSAEEVCQILSDSYKDFIAGAAGEESAEKDYLSFSTIVDVYLSRPFEYSDNDNKLILDKLTELLESDHELVYEVGWDIPTMLLDYFPCKSFFFRDRLAENKKLSSIFKLFSLLSRYGNPKELFLKTSEILSNLSFQDHKDFKFHVDAVEDRSLLDDEAREKFLNLKFHAIFELHVTSFKKITTMYPSKFLTMTVSSVLRFYNNNVVYLINPTFALKRILIFARDYEQPLLPPGFDTSADKDHAKVAEDEGYLQAKLLQDFVTTAVEVASRYFKTNVAITYYQQLIEKNTNKKFQTSNLVPGSRNDSIRAQGSLTSSTASVSSASTLHEESPYVLMAKGEFDDLLERYYQLGLSIDIDYSQIFYEDCLKSNCKLFETILEHKSNQGSSGDKNDIAAQDELTKQIFEITNNHFLQHLLGAPLSDRDTKKISVSIIGSFLTVTRHNLETLVDSNFKVLKYKITIKDSVLLALRFLIPILTLREQTSVNIRLPANRSIEGEAEPNVHFKHNIANRYQALQDAVIFWIWLAISNQSLQKNDILEITRSTSPFQILSKVFLQCLVSLAAAFQNDFAVRKVILTYLIKFLSLSDEQFAWEFLVLSLEACPYLNAKIELINILRDLAMRNKTGSGLVGHVSRKSSVGEKEAEADGQKSEDQLVEDLKKVDLNAGEATKPAAAPPAPKLPPRSYINLSANRKTRLLSLVYETVDDIFGNGGNKIAGAADEDTERDYFQLLLTFLNLVFNLKEKFSLDELNALHRRLGDAIATQDEESAKNKNQGARNNVGLLSLFNDQIASYIKSRADAKR